MRKPRQWPGLLLISPSILWDLGELMRQLDLVCFVLVSALGGLTRDFWGNCLIFGLHRAASVLQGNAIHGLLHTASVRRDRQKYP